jgi:hypothetical protein
MPKQKLEEVAANRVPTMSELRFFRPDSRGVFFFFCLAVAVLQWDRIKDQSGARKAEEAGRSSDLLGLDIVAIRFL